MATHDMDQDNALPPPRPSNRRSSVSFQDTCTVIPVLELRKPRLCTRTYSLCLSKKPPSDLLYDETFIPSHPTTLKFHLPTFTRAPPLPHKRSRRSSTGGTPGVFGYKGNDGCGMKSCLHWTPRHGYKNGHRIEHDEATGFKETPPIIHRDVPALAASPLLQTPSRSNSSILSPIRRDSQSNDTIASATPASPTSSHGGFGIAKMSSLVTRPFLRRSKTSSSAITQTHSETESLHAPLLSRSRSTSVGAASIGKGSASEEGKIDLTRTRSLGLPFGGDPLETIKPKVAPLMAVSTRHPGCIEEEAIEEEEDDEESIGMHQEQRQVEHRPHAVHRPSLLIPHSPIPEYSASVIPIHDCCEACTRTTLLGMRENYIPPFSPSAIRKLKREREEKEQGARIQQEIAQATAPVSSGPRRIWDGHSWVEEASTAADEQKTGPNHTSDSKDTTDDSDDDDPEQKKSSLGPTFGNEKARTMMVDEVEYVRRMRRASNASMEEAAQGEAQGTEKGKKTCFFSGEKAHTLSPKHTAEAISQDHGIWITSKPTPRSPMHSSSAGEERDYMNAKDALSSPTESEKLPLASPRHLQQPWAANQRPSTKPANDEKEIQRALEEEANEAKNARKVLQDGSPHSHSPAGKALQPDHIPSSDASRKKWYKLPLPSPLAVPGVS